MTYPACYRNTPAPGTDPLWRLSGPGRIALAFLICAVSIRAPALFAADAGASGGKDRGQACGVGARLYMEKCSQCHGEKGDGKGVGADFFRPRPRDFTSGAFKLRTTESGELPTDDDLKRVIRGGMPYTGMPAWPRFSEGEVADLVCYVKSFNGDFADTSIHPKRVPMPKAPAFSAASAQQGRAVYEENKCMDCHGSLGRGDGESAPTLKDDWGNPIRPADLTRRWTFRGGPQREDIYRTFMTGLNGTPMPSFLNSVKEEDRWKLVDYVYSLSPGDEPDYAAMVAAERAPSPLDRGRLREALAAAKPGLFPVVGQVIEGARDFQPAANAVEVRAVYDTDRVALLVSWHDMSAQKAGSNSPEPIASPADSAARASALSDAVALQIPAKPPEGAGKPYFLFGDKKNPVRLWFADAGRAKVYGYRGKGFGSLMRDGDSSAADMRYADGEWSMVFTLPRRPDKGFRLDAGGFAPIAFSLWDGTVGETGEKRGITAWYSLYLKPAGAGSPLWPAAGRAAAAFGILGAAILFARLKASK